MKTKPLFWMGSSRSDLKEFPEAVKDIMGFVLYVAQKGNKHPAAKPLKGFHGAGVLEIIENYSGNAFRVVYTTSLQSAVYVLHAFQKKSKSGIETPKRDIALIATRLKQASMHHESLFK